MSRVKSTRALGIVALSLFGAVGCPVLLSDDFKTVPPGDKDGGATDNGAGGSESTDAGVTAVGGAINGGDGGAGGSSAGGRITNANTGGFDQSGSGGVSDGAGGSGTGGGGKNPNLLGAGSAAGTAGTSSDAGNCTPCGALAACCPAHWTPVAAPDPSFVAREQAAYTALGTSVFIGGGADTRATELATGALYDAEANSWTTVPADSATPSARVLATAVWTGTTVVVWGGGDHANLTDYATGSRYDPAAKKWSAMSTAGAPTARRAPYGVWTGTRVLFWGGTTATHLPVGGAYLYDPVGDAWSAASVTNEPVAPLNPTVGWTGSALLVYGGRSGGTSFTGHTDAYDVGTNLWSQRPTGPQARMGAFGTWDGASLVAWGGTSSTMKRDGQRYSLAKNSWSNIISTGEPTARYVVNRETGWTARVADMTTLMLGGYDATETPELDGAYYDSTANTWTSVAAWPSGSAHLSGVGVWAGSAFVLWGGRTAPLGALNSVGERFRF